MQRSANRQSFSQRPAQQPPTNAKVMSTGSGPVSAQISSMFGPSHSQPLLHSHGGGGSSSGSSSNNRSMNDLPGVSTNYSWPLYSLRLCLLVTPAHLYHCIFYLLKDTMYLLEFIDIIKLMLRHC